MKGTHMAKNGSGRKINNGGTRKGSGNGKGPRTF